MGPSLAAHPPLDLRWPTGRPLRVAFVGPESWLKSCAPPPSSALLPLCLAFDRLAGETVAVHAREFVPDACVVLDPAAMPEDLIVELAAPSLGLLVGGLPEGQAAERAAWLDRIASFRPELSGQPVGSTRVWRAVPPPVSDRQFAPVRHSYKTPRAISIGRSSEHRETMLTPSKHHHDLLQVAHGLHDEELAEVLAEYDVGVYVAPGPGGGFGQQVGLHLAAGQLLLSERLNPSHGLERGIDYLQFDTPQELLWRLDRLTRFPEMHRRIRIRGRMKAEQYRASRLFTRLLQDFFADLAAFGDARPDGGAAGRTSYLQGSAAT